MDFKRIEWIFFVAFLGLNIFLFSIFHAAKNEESNVTSANQKIDIQVRLDNDDIKLNKQLSKDIHQGYYLSAEQTNLKEDVEKHRQESEDHNFLVSGTSYDGNALSRTPRGNFYISDDKKTASSLNSFLSQTDQILYGTQYGYIPHLSFADKEYPELIAAQSFDGIFFNDSTSRLELTLEERDSLMRISRYTQTHLNSIEKLREKMPLYSERDAVETLYINNKLPQKSRILWSELFYTMILQVRGKNVYVPAWFIAVESGQNNTQVEVVNAFSNRIITNNQLQKVENTD